MYKYLPITQEIAPKFQLLTLPVYRSFNKWEDESTVAIGAMYFMQPVGLIIARLSENNRYAMVISLAVVSEHRQRGVATSLLQHLEQVLKERGCEQVEIHYAANQDSTPALEHLLAKVGWRAPQLFRMIVQTDTQRYLQSFVPAVELPLPPDYHIFAWRDLTAADRQHILDRQQNTPGGWYHAIVDPFIVKNIDEVSSLGLRYQGEVIGWLVNERLAPDRVYYIELFVAREHKGKSLGGSLGLEAFRRQTEDALSRGINMQGFGTLMPDSKFTHMIVVQGQSLCSIWESRFSYTMLQNPDAEPIFHRTTHLPEHLLTP